MQILIYTALSDISDFYQYKFCFKREIESMVCAPVRKDNARALARGLLTVQAHKPCSISLVPRYPVYTLHVTEYLVLKRGICELWYKWIPNSFF